MEIPEELQVYFSELDLRIGLFMEEGSFEIKKMESLYDFLKSEEEFWKDYRFGRIGEVKNHFNARLNELNILLDTFSTNPVDAKNKLKRLVDTLKKDNFPQVYSKSPISVFLTDRYINDRNKSTKLDAAIAFLTNTPLSSLGTNEYFEGALDAYNFKNFDEQEKRFSKSQETSLTNLKSQYYKDLDKLHTDYFDKKHEVEESVDNFKFELNSWKDETQNKTANFLEEKRQRFQDLEQTYIEKLALSAPASYWKSLENEYESRGKNWIYWTMATSLMALLILGIVLYNLPESLVQLDFSFNTFRATIVLTVIISILVYLIRLFVKLSISAYHLSRDARERYQLTYVYLSLLKESAIDKSEKNTVFQSLFSRADTGLLKGDSSPTLPDGIMNQILRMINK